MYQKVFKRVFDLFFAVISMVIFLVLYIVVGLAIKIEDGGPILFSGERLGRNGKSYRMYKFRSMKVNAPDWRLKDGSTYNAEDDPRQTKVGKILRKTSLDEVPQLINIIKGEMSFIGPRPDPIDWLEKYSDDDKVLLKVLPGVSGYNQAYFRNSTNGRQKTDNDVFYTKNISFLLDVRIIFVTILSVFIKKNIYKDSTSVSREKLEL
ncbi:sugar transferase [Paenibacillus sp. HJGM_3]|uniref:sugar transferase n=1 Tax=Paenibacillus sp. HJGM_3 TaxID=3379816 RepID=UPI003859B163